MAPKVPHGLCLLPPGASLGLEVQLGWHGESSALLTRGIPSNLLAASQEFRRLETWRLVKQGGRRWL